MSDVSGKVRGDGEGGLTLRLAAVLGEEGAAGSLLKGLLTRDLSL